METTRNRSSKSQDVRAGNIMAAKGEEGLLAGLRQRHILARREPY